MTAVLKAAADKFGYTPAKNPDGRGYGIACGQMSEPGWLILQR